LIHFISIILNEHPIIHGLYRLHNNQIKKYIDIAQLLKDFIMLWSQRLTPNIYLFGLPSNFTLTRLISFGHPYTT